MTHLIFLCELLNEALLSIKEVKCASKPLQQWSSELYLQKNTSKAIEYVHSKKAIFFLVSF
jgi:hypothetical protein